MMILAQLADPQIGFQNYEAELLRFRKEIELLQNSDCQAVIVCGDLMHKVTRESLAVYLQELKNLQIPVYHVPGNHDVGSPEARAAYTDLIGPVYYAADLPDPAYRLIVLDTFLWMEDTDPAETEKMDDFLQQELQCGKKIVIASHTPVFADSFTEPETYFNLPHARRKDLLELLEKYPVSAWFSGHTHTAFTYTFCGTLFSGGATTSVAFDGINYGFRRFVFDGDLIHYRTIPVN